jgi:WD40 repeat protein
VLSADGGLAYVGNVTGEIQVRGGEDLEESRAIAAFDSGISGLDLSPDERTLVALTVDGHAALWDASTGAKLHDLGDGHKQANSARFSPNSRRVAIAGREPAVSLWDVATGRLLHQISSDSMAFAAAFSPDGRWLAYTARLRRIEIADASTLATVRVLEGHSHVPVCVAFSPDGRIVASGAADGAVRLWEAGTGGALSTIRFGDSEISRIVFTPDGRRLIAAGRQGKVWVCDLAYFDRHIAGNARFQAARQKDWIPPSTDTAPLFRWADAVLADVTPAATPSPAVPGAAE